MDVKRHMLKFLSYPCWWIGGKNEVVIKWKELLERWEIVINKVNREKKNLKKEMQLALKMSQLFLKFSLEWVMKSYERFLKKPRVLVPIICDQN